MKNLALAAALALPLAFSGCQQAVQVADTVCTDMAKLSPVVVAALDSLPATSAAGVDWAYAKSACVGVAIKPGVTPDWAGMVWGMVKTAAPAVLPYLLGLL